MARKKNKGGKKGNFFEGLRPGKFKVVVKKVNLVKKF